MISITVCQKYTNTTLNRHKGLDYFTKVEWSYSILEVAKRALELNASALILVHNHPSGDPTPSQADIDMTQQIFAACSALGLTLHDHLIIGKSRELSFRSEGYL